MEINKNYDLKEIVYFCEYDKVYKTEIFKDVPGYEELYQVSDLGRVRSLGNKKNKKPKILKLVINKQGYFIVTFSKHQKNKTKKVHQLVAICFLNHTPCGYDLIINHINIKRTDNRAKNLELVTLRENNNKKHIKSSSQYVGVSWNKDRKKWTASIGLNRRVIYLGLFVNEIDAHNAYEKELKIINMAKKINQ